MFRGGKPIGRCAVADGLIATRLLERMSGDWSIFQEIATMPESARRVLLR
jgi:hypothetical protein